MKMIFPAAVFLDLDGTLLDTAPDLLAALNYVRYHYARLAPLSLAEIRSVCSDGAKGLLQAGLKMLDSHQDYVRCRQLLLDYYQANIADHTQLFAGMADFLSLLENQQIPWGVVTNKPAALTEKLLTKIGLFSRCACVVSGDSLPQKKPDPAPLLYAADQTQVNPSDCWYIGDALRDMQAAHAAGMFGIAALYGYLHAEDDPSAWPAHGYVHAPVELAKML